MSVSAVIPYLRDGVPRYGEEGERGAHDRHEPGADNDVGLGDLDLHHLDDGGDARRDQGRRDEVLRLFRPTVCSVCVVVVLTFFFVVVSSISRQ